MKIQARLGISILLTLGLFACSGGEGGGEEPKPTGGETAPAVGEKEEEAPKGPRGPFTLAWSEYPSWSAFDVASSKGYLNGKEGELGTFEEKFNVDIVLKQAEYDACLTMYGANQVDAVAITNMDILNPSMTRTSVAILPTSTSYGADAVIVDKKKVKNIKALKKFETKGLDLSVSQYMFARNLELQKQDPKKFKFTSMDPGAAAIAMQQKDKKTVSIAVWNPFVMSTLEKRGKDVKVLFDSTSIPGEIIDMIVMAEDSLKKDGGADAAHAIIAAFYALNQDMADEGKREDTLKAIGEKFANLDAKQMEKVVDMTRFYGTADLGIQVFTDGALLEGVTEKKISEIMPEVVKFSTEYGIIEKEPKITYGADGDGNLRFDPTYMKNVKAAM
ncbi:MAG: hypothetical protein AAFU77_10105 [Myxococcota bacterium]